MYCYSFEPNPDWSLTYAGRAEIQAYLRRCAEKYDLLDKIRFGTRRGGPLRRGRRLLGADAGRRHHRRHRALVSATGGLTDPALPRIEGLDRFAGPAFHSGAWRHDVDVAGKRVAVVGSAASAVQVVPEMAKVAAEVFVFSRTPNWVTPRNNTPYSDEDRQRLRDPEQWRKVWRRQYRESMLWYGAFRRRPEAIAKLRETCLANLHGAIADPALRAALTPDFDPGCNRILVSDDYYPALAQPHVHLVPHGVTALTETAVVAADGTHTEVDVVIFCTGYRLGGRADGRPAVEVLGRDGMSLRQAFGREPEAWRGMLVPGFPNFFTVCG
ncbi:MAG: NAD(P)/FAD-dependent oxidoreductase [Acidimicrobiales bacterium]